MGYKESWNFMSHWFPKVENCGIRVPKTIIIPVEDKAFTSIAIWSMSTQT